jgi:tetratricopeptide (TPR) repeat protein
MNMRRALTLGLLAVAMLASNAFAVGEARLVGKVTDLEKKPISGVTIQVTAVSGKNFKQTFKAKADGSYSIFLLDGTIKYKFIWEAPGFVPYEETIKLKLGEQNVRDIQLGKPGSGNAAAAAPAAEQAKPDPALVAFNEGAELANQGKDAEAIAKFESAIVTKPDLTAAYIALARLYTRSKNYPKVIVNGEKATELAGDDPDIDALLAEAYEHTGNKAKAVEYEKKAPANPAALFNEAARAINAQKDSAAEPLLKKAIELDEKFAPAYYELGMLYARASKNGDAKANLQKYIDLEPNGKDVATAKEMIKYLK